MVLNRESRFTLGLNTTKNTDYFQKFFKLKLLSIKFLTKKSVGAYVYLRQEWNCGAPKVAFLKYCNALKWENSLYGWMLSELPIITKHASNKICWESHFLQKSQWAYVSISLRSGAWELVIIPIHTSGARSLVTILVHCNILTIANFKHP